MVEPLTDEQIWGLPAAELPIEEPDNFCEYKERKCHFWDHGCQAKYCVIDLQTDAEDEETAECTETN